MHVPVLVAGGISIEYISVSFLLQDQRSEIYLKNLF